MLSVIKQRGYFGIGIYHPKIECNLGTLWRSANCFGASFIFTIGHRYKHQCSDTTKAWRHIPLISYTTFDQFLECIPKDCKLIGIEQNISASYLTRFCHPERCIYLLGAEDNGLPKSVINTCQFIVEISTIFCLNIATAGAIVMYDRKCKGEIRGDK